MRKTAAVMIHIAPSAVNIESLYLLFTLIMPTERKSANPTTSVINSCKSINCVQLPEFDYGSSKISASPCFEQYLSDQTTNLTLLGLF